MDVFVNPDRAYSMDLPKMGHAVLINNIAGEQPGSSVDVQCMEDALETIGFTVHVHENCTDQQMRKHKKWMLREENHEDSNCFVLVILCHGNDKGHLLDRNRKKAWDTEDVVGDLSEVESLRGKPKVMVIQACRGTQWSDGRRVPVGTLADDDEIASTHILPDKADMFLAYATVPGYRAFAGDKTGSIYLQTFSKYLKQFYMRLPLDRIYLLVKQSMVQSVQGEQGMRQASEERNSLTYLLRFADFHKKDEIQPETTDPPSLAKPKNVLSQQKSANDEVQSDEEFLDATDTWEENRKGTISEEKVTAEVVTTAVKEEVINAPVEVTKELPSQTQTPTETPEEQQRETPAVKKTPETATTTAPSTEEGDNIAAEATTPTESTPTAVPIAEAFDIASRMSVRGFSERPQISIKIVGKGDSVENEEPRDDGKDKKGEMKEETKESDELKVVPAADGNETKDSLQVEAAGAEGGTSLKEVESVVQKEFLGTGQVMDEDETSGRITLKHQSTTDPDLVEWSGTKMTVMPSSGDLLVWGQAKKKLGSSKVAFHTIRCTNGKWKKKSSFSALCDHSTEVHISPVTIAGQETLGVSCFSCRNIKFYDIERGETTFVYSCPVYVPHGFCPGEPDFLFVLAQNEEMNKNQILKLHYESDFFTVCQSFEPDLNLESRRQDNLLGTALMKMVDLSNKVPYSLQFVPNYNLLLLSSSQKGIIQAIDCSKEVVVWRHALKPEVEAEVNRGAFYFPESDTILVADGSDHKIVVLSPNDGSYMHSIALFDYVGSLSEIALRGDTIILLHSVKHKEKISFYTISGERSDDDDIETKRRITKRRLTSRRSGSGSKKS